MSDSLSRMEKVKGTFCETLEGVLMTTTTATQAATVTTENKRCHYTLIFSIANKAMRTDGTIYRENSGGYIGRRIPTREERALIGQVRSLLKGTQHTCLSLGEDLRITFKKGGRSLSDRQIKSIRLKCEEFVSAKVR